MRKTMKKILAVVLCLSVLLTISPIAFAKEVIADDGGYNFKGVYRVQQGQLIKIQVPESIRGAEAHTFYIDDESIAVSTQEDESGYISVIGRLWGATVISFESYNVEKEEIDGELCDVYETVETLNYVIMVFDEEDANMTGKVTGVTVGDVNCHYDDEGELNYEVEQDGEVYYDTIVYFEDDGFVFDNYGSYHAYDRGNGEGILYVIDTNGNIVSDTFTATAKMTPVQWIKSIIRDIFYLFINWLYGGFDYR